MDGYLALTVASCKTVDNMISTRAQMTNGSIEVEELRQLLYALSLSQTKATQWTYFANQDGERLFTPSP